MVDGLMLIPVVAVGAVGSTTTVNPEEAARSTPSSSWTFSVFVPVAMLVAFHATVITFGDPLVHVPVEYTYPSEDRRSRYVTPSVAELSESLGVNEILALRLLGPIRVNPAPYDDDGATENDGATFL